MGNDNAFTKLFASIIHSTVWREPDHVRLIWVTMLVMADADGYVWSSLPGLADAARVTLEQAQDALDRLHAPDLHSRSKDYEGRRVETVDRGWKLLNYKAFRERMSAEQEKIRKRDWWRENRAKDATSEPLATASGQLDALDTCRGQKQKQRKKTEEDPEEDPEEIQIARKALTPKRWRRFPSDYEPTAEHKLLAIELGVNLAAQMPKLRDHEFARPKSDPAATLRTWIRNASEYGTPANVNAKAASRPRTGMKPVSKDFSHPDPDWLLESPQEAAK